MMQIICITTFTVIYLSDVKFFQIFKISDVKWLFFCSAKTRKTFENSKNTRRTAKIVKNTQKIIQNQTKTPKRHPNTQIIFSENLNFYSKPKIISKNLNPNLKKISEIPKYTQIYLIYIIFFGYFGYPIGSRIGPGLKSRSADPKKNDPTGILVWP